MMPLEFQTGFI